LSHGSHFLTVLLPVAVIKVPKAFRSKIIACVQETTFPESLCDTDVI